MQMSLLFWQSGKLVICILTERCGGEDSGGSVLLNSSILSVSEGRGLWALIHIHREDAKYVCSSLHFYAVVNETKSSENV